jgi:hypothetical protein
MRVHYKKTMMQIIALSLKKTRTFYFQCAVGNRITTPEISLKAGPFVP